MKIQMILCCFIPLLVAINAQKFPNMPKQRVTLDKPHHHSSPEERRKNSVFPKMTRKFVVTMNPEDQPYILDTTAKTTTVTLKPLEKNIKSKTAHSYVSNKIPKAIVNPTTARPTIILPKRFPYKTVEVKGEPKEIFEEVNETQQEVDEEEFNEPEVEYETEKSGEVIDDMFDDQEQVDDVLEDHRDKREELVKSVQKRSWVFVSIPMINKHDSSSGESDEKQFIFMKNDELLNKAKEDEEITTEYVTEPSVTPKRIKRSDNIIEEENMGTTISGFKFTGRVAHQSNHLVFKNINT